MAGSEYFRRFVDSYHDSGSSRSRHENFDLDALARLEGAERDAAEILLIERLEKKKEDPRVPRALMAMQPSKKATEAMRIALASFPSNHTRVALALALWQLEQNGAPVDILADMVRKSGRPDRRIAAMNALGELPGELADEALLHAVEHDTDDTARMAAELALCEKYKIEHLRRVKGTLCSLSANLRDDEQKTRDAAMSDLRLIVERLREGRTPESLGIVPLS